jgi:hypothetical protein
MKMMVTSNGEHRAKVGVDVQPDSLARYRASGTKTRQGRWGVDGCGDTQCGDAGARPTRRQLRRPGASECLDGAGR